MLSRRACLALVAGLLGMLLLVSLPPATEPHAQFQAFKGSVQDHFDRLRQAAVYGPPHYNHQAAGQAQLAAQGFLLSSKVAAPPSVPTAALDYEEDKQDDAEAVLNLAALRAHLEKEHAPHGISSHSPTMHFSHIYVVPASNATPAELHSRQKRMQQMSIALGLDVTYVQATSAQDPLVKWIAERVAETRELKRPFLDNTQSSRFRRNPARAWLQPSTPPLQLTFPDNAISPTWQKQQEAHKFDPALQLPSLQKKQYEGLDWVEFLHAHTGSSSRRLQPAHPDLDVGRLLQEEEDASSPSFPQVSAESIATWHTHANLLRLMIKNQDTSALVLSDSVDLERDIERIWLALAAQLPEEDGSVQTSPWQMVFLGHDSSLEQTNPAYLHPLLHHAAEPRGLHAYAVSKLGYTEISRMLSDPWVAYQSPFDVAVSTFSQNAALSVFTVDPPIAVSLPPDLAAFHPESVTARSDLADSVMERLWSSQGLALPRPKAQDSGRNTSNYRVSSPRPPSGFKPHKRPPPRQAADRQRQTRRRSVLASEP